MLFHVCLLLFDCVISLPPSLYTMTYSTQLGKYQSVSQPVMWVILRLCMWKKNISFPSYPLITNKGIELVKSLWRGREGGFNKSMSLLRQISSQHFLFYAITVMSEMDDWWLSFKSSTSADNWKRLKISPSIHPSIYRLKQLHCHHHHDNDFPIDCSFFFFCLRILAWKSFNNILEENDFCKIVSKIVARHSAFWEIISIHTYMVAIRK